MSGGIAPRILSLGTKWKWVITPTALYLGKNTMVPIEWRSGSVPEPFFVLERRNNFLSLMGIELRFVGLPACNTITVKIISTDIQGLLCPSYVYLFLSLSRLIMYTRHDKFKCLSPNIFRYSLLTHTAIQNTIHAYPQEEPVKGILLNRPVPGICMAAWVPRYWQSL